MTTGQARASSGWLALREPADAEARSAELLEAVRSSLPAGGTTIHDLGCGTGSMARWAAARLPGPQRWVMYDRDEELLPFVSDHPPERSADGAPVVVETRCRDITGLAPADLADADLITASALLDMLTAQELGRLVDSCAAPGCPVLVTLSVTGHVELTPPDPVDRCVQDAFNAHQRRTTSAGTLLGPDAVGAALDRFRRQGREVLVRSSPWRLGPEQAALAVEWLGGWLGAAYEQQPELATTAGSYDSRRRAEAAAGRLSVTVDHQDLLVLPA